MTNLKDIFMEVEDVYEKGDDDSVEVFADSVNQALELASQELGVDIFSLDYEIVQKGIKGFFGIGRKPYHLIISPIKTSNFSDNFDNLEIKLTGGTVQRALSGTSLQKDGSFKIRVTKTGVWLSVKPPSGKGARVTADQIEMTCFEMKISEYNKSLAAEAITKKEPTVVKIAEWLPNPNYDGSMRVEVSEDEMRSFVHFVKPKFSGRHMDYEDVLDGLENAGVVSGIREEQIKEYLEEMNYSRPLLAAEGVKPRDGDDAFIDYKVRVDKSKIKFEEDEAGKVDFRNLELLENVVVGQTLAVKIPAQKGVFGKTIKDRILPSEDGRDISIQFGKGTILSEDGTKLIAEINGQVVFKSGKISVEPVYIVPGDVSLETGNILFLGSVIIQGSVQDNFEVKAAGNIEVKGTVQKALLEAEGDIIVYQGVSGKDEAKVESTGGSVFAKFCQNSYIVAAKNVVIPEGVLHSRIDAGEKIYSNGRRAKIAGGVIRAGDEVNARFLGAEGGIKTVFRVGVDPKILQQMDDLNDSKNEIEEELTNIRLDMKTLSAQKRNSSKFPKDKEKLLADITARENKLADRLGEVSAEIEELNSDMAMLQHTGKVCAEKVAYPGVEIYINNADFKVKDEYKHVKFSLEADDIYISDYDQPDLIEGSQRINTVVRRR